MKTTTLLLALMLIAGCDKVRTGPPEMVEIVAVVEDTEDQYRPKYYTVVEFPDGDRRRIHFKAGEVGDTFTARRFGTSRVTQLETPEVR